MSELNTELNTENHIENKQSTNTLTKYAIEPEDEIELEELDEIKLEYIEPRLQEIDPEKEKRIQVFNNLEVAGEELLPIEQIKSEIVREKYPTLPKEKAIEELNKLMETWITGLNRTSTLQKVLLLGIKNFGMGHGRRELNMDNIQKGYRQNVYTVLTLYNYFKKNKIIKEKHSVTKQEYFIIFNKLLEIIYYTEQTVRSGLRMRMVLDEGYESSMNDDIGLFKFSEINISDNTPYQNLILYLLRKLNENQWRRYREYVYEMVFNKKGYFTYSWKECKESPTIKGFVHRYTNKEKNFEMWKNATKNKTNIRDAIAYLEDCDSAEFPELKKRRDVFSFNNGIYFINRKNEKGENMDFWYEYGQSPKPPSSVVACRHFDCEFNNYSDMEMKDWAKIPTPNLDRIINYQFSKEKEYKEITKWMYIFIGKMLYPVGELERWQIMPYLHGIGGAGKSSICEVIKNIYESKDVGVIENTIEEKFGLAPICDKYIFIAPEIKKNFTLDQALFQKIISGEEVCLPQKNKDPVQVTWNLPGFMASNEAPGFIDASGSISRRLIVFKFIRMVTRDMIDPDLILKLRREIPAIIKKCNMAYLHTVNTNKSKDIWSIVPEYFHDTREALGRETNPLKSFLGSGLVKFDKEFFVKEKDFKTTFKDYCNENNYGRPRWTEALYEEPFAMYGSKYGIKIKLKKEQTVSYPRVNPLKRKFTGNIIYGIELNKPEGEQEQEMEIEETN